MPAGMREGALQQSAGYVPHLRVNQRNGGQCGHMFQFFKKSQKSKILCEISPFLICTKRSPCLGTGPCLSTPGNREGRVQVRRASKLWCPQALVLKTKGPGDKVTARAGCASHVFPCKTGLSQLSRRSLSHLALPDQSQSQRPGHTGRESVNKNLGKDRCPPSGEVRQKSEVT